MSTNVITGKLKQSHHCTNRAAFCAASTSRLPAWIIGWFAITPTGRPSSRPSAVIMFGAYAARELEERVVVEHVADDGAHVVRRHRARRHHGSGARAVTVDGIVGDLDRRIFEVVRREVPEQEARDEQGVVLVGDDHGRDAALALVHRRASEAVTVDRDTRERHDDVGPAHVREGVVGHDHVVGDAEQQRRAGDRRPDEQQDDRHDARRVDHRPGDPPPRVQRRDPFADVGARARHPPDHGDPEVDGEADGPLHRLALGGADRAPVLAAVEAEPAHLAAVELHEAGIDGGAAVPEDGRAVGGRDHSTGARMSAALCPPNPNEFDSTGVAPISRTSPETMSRPMSSPICSRLAVGGAMPLPSESSAMHASAAPGAADHVPGDALGGRDRRRGVVAEDLADRGRFGRVVQRRRRAVRVDVPDLRRGQARVVERELHARGRALAAG